MKKYCRPLFFVVLLVCALPLLAQDGPVDESTLSLPEASQPGEVNLPSTSIWPYLLRMVLVLGLVIAAIYGLVYVLKRRGASLRDDDPFIRNLGSLALAPGKTVHVVSVGGRAWLVGASDATVSLISEVEDQALIEAMTKRAEENPRQNQGDFASVLAAILPARGRGQGRGGSSFLGRQKDRLKRF